MMDGIVSAVRDAMARKASIERVADSITGYFVPVIVGIACMTFGIWIVRGYSGNLPFEWLEGDVGRKGGWALFAVQFTVAVLVVVGSLSPIRIDLVLIYALYAGLPLWHRSRCSHCSDG
jgi:cation transport ATPase